MTLLRATLMRKRKQLLRIVARNAIAIGNPIKNSSNPGKLVSLKTNSRKEKRCGPDFFIKCHFDVFMRGAQKQ